MCRLLSVRARTSFAIGDFLEKFAAISKDSPEYQGHGWGCAWLDDGKWQFHHDIRPIWEDDLSGFGSTSLLMAHARSAFRDEGICVENNMPFFDGRYVFIFNGELQGVRIRERGRIGAEKIFNYVKRFDKDDILQSLKRGVSVIEKRTRYVRAMNFIMADLETTYLVSDYAENPDYFQLHRRRDADMDLICSVAFPGESNWQAIDNHIVTAL
jgi:predicted glutamine amidotransferase